MIFFSKQRIIHFYLSGDNLQIAGGGPGSGGDGAVQRVAVSLRVPANIFLKSEYKNIYIVKTFIPEDIGCGGASLRGAAQRQRVAL